MRPIDADALLKHRRNHGKPYAIDPIDKNIDDQIIDLEHVLNAPTLDYVPVRHGELVNIGFLTCQCSECRTIFHDLPCENYCPNCGARMDGKEDS